MALPALRFGKIHIYPSAVLLPALIYFLNAGYFVLLTVIAVIIHELGHYLTLRLCGGEVKCIKLRISGVSLVFGELGYTGETVTAFAGPLINLLLAFAAAAIGRFVSFTPAYHLAGFSLLLALFNLLPVFPLDGGRVIFALSAGIFGLGIAERVRKICAVIVCAAIGLAGAAILVFYRNPTLFIAAAILTTETGEI